MAILVHYPKKFHLGCSTQGGSPGSAGKRLPLLGWSTGEDRAELQGQLNDVQQFVWKKRPGTGRGWASVCRGRMHMQVIATWHP